MTSPSSTPSTTPQSFEVVDPDAIQKNWERVKNQKPEEVVAKHIKFHRENGASPELIQALNLVWSDMHFLYGGGFEKMSEKK